jgi:hypothetical protein
VRLEGESISLPKFTVAALLSSITFVLYPTDIKESLYAFAGRLPNSKEPSSLLSELFTGALVAISVRATVT